MKVREIRGTEAINWSEAETKGSNQIKAVDLSR
jgi:hypothetical protein